MATIHKMSSSRYILFYKHILFLFVPFQVLCGLLGYLPLHGTVLIVVQSAHDVHKFLAAEAIEKYKMFVHYCKVRMSKKLYRENAHL